MSAKLYPVMLTLDEIQATQEVLIHKNWLHNIRAITLKLREAEDWVFKHGDDCIEK